MTTMSSDGSTAAAAGTVGASSAIPVSPAPPEADAVEAPTPADELADGAEETVVKRCRPCEMGPAVVIVLAGAGMLYIGIDLLSGGALTRLLARRFGAVEGGADAEEPVV